MRTLKWQDKELLNNGLPFAGIFKRNDRLLSLKYSKQWGKMSRDLHPSNNFEEHYQSVIQKVLASSVVVHRIAIWEGLSFGSSWGHTFSFIPRSQKLPSICIHFKFTILITRFTTPFKTSNSGAHSIETKRLLNNLTNITPPPSKRKKIDQYKI